MRILLSILFLFISFTHLQGQENTILSEDENVPVSEIEKEVKVINIESRIKTWSLQNQFSTQKFMEVDSSTYGFHNYNPMYQQSISNTYLGYMGSPYQSNIYFDRTNESEFYFLQNFDAYRKSNSEVRFYNTTTPYASLTYAQGDQGSNATEQKFIAFFTQNIDSITNFGFEFSALKAPGQYVSQEGKHKHLNIFASRNARRLNSYISITNASDYLKENGGIVDNGSNQFNWFSILDVPFQLRVSPYQLNTNLSNQIENEYKSFTAFTSHEYLMGRIPFFNDSLNIDTLNLGFTPKYSIQYSAEFESHNRKLLESSVDKNFFDTTFIKLSKHTDSTYFTRFSHIIQIKAFEDENRKFTFGKRAFIENEMVSAKHPMPSGQRIYTYSNVYLGGEIYKTNSSIANWSATARFAVLGRNIGDAIIKGLAKKEIRIGKDTTILMAEAWYQDISPNIFQEHWFSNHFKWENDFKKQHEVAVKGAFSYPQYKAKAGVNYALLSNYLYNNSEAVPDQYNGEFSIFSAWINKDLHFGRFVWSNKAVWQELSNDAVLHLPTWNFYTSIFYSHYLFKVMKIQLGAELFYHSRFLSDRYNPATTSFYVNSSDLQLQMDPVTFKLYRYDNNLTGGYPLLNLYVNAKLKRTSAFVQLFHANSIFNFGDFSSAVNYPIDQMAFRFGFFWTFYD